MKMAICYFSGTGNCLSVARDISEKTKCILISIPHVIKKNRITIDADQIGIVFPTYLAPLSGIPLIIERFIRKVHKIDTKYLFAVCTCGGYEMVNALPSLRNLSKLIKSIGGKLSAAYSVRLPMNNLEYDHIPVPIIKDQEIIIKKSKKKISYTIKRIIRQKREKYHFIKSSFNWLMTPIYKIMQNPVMISMKEYAKLPQDSTITYKELIPLTDKSIIVNENCNGCSICSRVCPVKNIEIIANKPVWKHHCEMCFACDEWCPQHAIQHWSRAKGIKYHHPDVNIKDMIMRTEND